MPIEEVLVTVDDNTNIASKLLKFWIKEISSIYPYGLNDNIRSPGQHFKKLGQGLVCTLYLVNKHVSIGRE